MVLHDITKKSLSQANVQRPSDAVFKRPRSIDPQQLNFKRPQPRPVAPTPTHGTGLTMDDPQYIESQTQCQDPPSPVLSDDEGSVVKEDGTPFITDSQVPTVGDVPDTFEGEALPKEKEAVQEEPAQPIVVELPPAPTLRQLQAKVITDFQKTPYRPTHLYPIPLEPDNGFWHSEKLNRLAKLTIHFAKSLGRPHKRVESESIESHTAEHIYHNGDCEDLAPPRDGWETLHHQSIQLIRLINFGAVIDDSGILDLGGIENASEFDWTPYAKLMCRDVRPLWEYFHICMNQSCIPAMEWKLEDLDSTLKKLVKRFESMVPQLLSEAYERKMVKLYGGAIPAVLPRHRFISQELRKKALFNLVKLRIERDAPQMILSTYMPLLEMIWNLPEKGRGVKTMIDMVKMKCDLLYSVCWTLSGPGFLKDVTGLIPQSCELARAVSWGPGALYVHRDTFFRLSKAFEELKTILLQGRLDPAFVKATGMPAAFLGAMALKEIVSSLLELAKPVNASTTHRTRSLRVKISPTSLSVLADCIPYDTIRDSVAALERNIDQGSVGYAIEDYIALELGQAEHTILSTLDAAIPQDQITDQTLVQRTKEEIKTYLMTKPALLDGQLVEKDEVLPQVMVVNTPMIVHTLVQCEIATVVRLKEVIKRRNV